MKSVGVALILVAVGLAGCTANDDGDGDADGLKDSEEKRGWEIIADLLGRRVSYQVTSDPDNPDTDGDGVDDQTEFRLGLDPRKADTDEDGLTDCQELFHTNATECADPDYPGPYDGGYPTNPLNADSDPGFSRYWEHIGFIDETTTVSFPITWGDGILDGGEVKSYLIELADGRTRFVTTNPMHGDTDGDGLDDGEELHLFGTDPTVADTNGNGCADGLDPMPAHDVLYDLGLISLGLLEGGDFYLRIGFAEHSWRAPESGTLFAAPNSSIDLSQLNEPRNLAKCTISPRHPWMLAQVHVIRVDNSGETVLDLHSFNDNAQVSGSVGSHVWFNPQTGKVAWVQDGEALPDEQQLSGPDGSLLFAPQVT